MVSQNTSDRKRVDSDFDEMKIRESLENVSSLHFSRHQKPAKLEDFEYRKVLGRGSFGKVLLVQNRVTKKLYAMKVIRKDLVLEQDIL